MKTWAQLLAASNAELFAWAGEQPWADPMRRCGQDAGWHAEGDVWTHTGMVFEQVATLAEYSTLAREEQIVLLLVALLHDAGKPATTVLDPATGRTRSPQHSIVGAALARVVLRELGCDLRTREHVAHLVRYHGKPPYLLEANSPEREVIRLSWLLSNQLLYLIALADTRGRVTAETSRAEEALGLWRDVAEENRCLWGGYPFANDQARFLFYRRALSDLFYTPHEDYACTVTLMCGLPGAGKDSWLARERPALPVVSLDQVREELDIGPTDNQGSVIQAAREQCRVHLRAQRDFAFNATNLTTLVRRSWVDLFADYNARVEIVYLEPSLATVLRQNRERERVVPVKVIQKLQAKLEIPTIAEAHAVEWVQTE